MTETPTTFRVVFRRTTRMILGIEPEGEVGAKNDIATLDYAEYDNVQKYDPSYLSADGQHVVGEPPA